MPLVFDLGMNDGSDTDYYLGRGFQVVGVEANPHLFKHCVDRFNKQVVDGSFTPVNAAIWAEKERTLPFYINKANSHWSSLETRWATAKSPDVEMVMVHTTTVGDLIDRFGVPYALKSDVEGVDFIVLKQVFACKEKPKYISVEDCSLGYEYLETLRECGYTKFQLVDQSTVKPGTSGPLGDELTDWISYERIVEEYSHTVRTNDGVRLASRDHWWDIHATT